MKIFKYILIAFIFLVVVNIVGYILIGYFVVDTVDKTSDYVEEVKSLVGKDVIYKDDTLTIIDYSVVNETYKLDNGKEYNIEFVKKLEFIDE